MIEIINKKGNKKKQTPYYQLIFNYMIGDSNGSTSEEMDISIEDIDIVEKFIKIISKLEPTKGYWGISLDKYRIGYHRDEGQINDEEYGFLTKVMFEYDKNDETAGYFYECVQSETEYSYLTFEGVDLYYYDEYGEKHDTIVK